MSMKIFFYDVEHGSCCHIITPNNKHILVDIGSKSGKSIVDHIKRKYFSNNGGTVDELIITHPHEDHIYDLPNLYKKLKPIALKRDREAFDIYPAQNTALHKEIADYANEMNKVYNQPISDDCVPTCEDINGGVKFDFIEPKSEWTTKKDLNTFSSIIVVEYRGYKFVLTGDNPKNILQKMIDLNHKNIKEKIKNATILLAPHHGRKEEFCQEFFSCVSPLITVVSDEFIIYSTQEETSRLYAGRGAEIEGRMRYVLTTRSDGTIEFEIKDNTCFVNLGKEDY